MDGANGAASIRPSASITCNTYNPMEHSIHTMGHDLHNVSSLYKYVDADQCLVMLGATILAGWLAMPWGQHGLKPKLASLMSLESIGYIPMKDLENIVDLFFHLHDKSPPSLVHTNNMRPFVHATFAMLVIYYVECVHLHKPNKTKVVAMLGLLQEVVQATLPQFVSPHNTLCE